MQKGAIIAIVDLNFSQLKGMKGKTGSAIKEKGKDNFCHTNFSVYNYKAIWVFLLLYALYCFRYLNEYSKGEGLNSGET